MSTVLAVRQALVALWAAQLGLPAGGVRLGSRVTLSPDERLAVGPARGSSEPGAMSPGRTIVEDYTIACTISVTRSGTADDQLVASTRAWAVLAAADTALRSVPGMNAGVTGVLWAYVAGDWTETEPAAAETRGSVNTTIEFTVRVSARYRLTLP